MITNVIFDMDGLLLDTETIYTVVQEQLCTKYNRTFTWDLKVKMMGQKALTAAQTLIDDLNLHNELTPEDFIIQREVLLDEMFPDAPVLPGVERLLRYLHKNNIPFCLATSSHRRHFDLKTSKHKELFSLFDHIITGDQVEKGKPDPEIFIKARDAWGLQQQNNKKKVVVHGGGGGSSTIPISEQCLVFEDAPSGVQAAKAAGMRCIMVPDAKLDTSYHGEADEVLKSLFEFNPVKYGLPPFTTSETENESASPTCFAHLV